MKTPSASSQGEAHRILLIDDNKSGLNARKAVLEEQGYVTDIASTPEDGLKQFADVQYSLVITDYKMPRMNGVELIGAMRQARPEIPIIMLSGLVDAVGLNERNTGADLVLAKNATEIQHLIRAIPRLLRRAGAKRPGRVAPVKQRVARTV